MGMSETANTAPQLVSATPEAVEELKRLMRDFGEKLVRLGVRGGGCSGYSYVLEFEDGAQEEDHQIEQDGLTFVLDKKSAIYLKGTILHFSGGLQGKGFVFRNPNATSTCGCGESFSV